MSKVIPISREIEAEQYLAKHTDWQSMECLVEGAAHLSIEARPFQEFPVLIVEYEGREYEVTFSDWVVKYPDGSLHFFSKWTFDELYHNPFTDPVTDDEINSLVA